LQKSAMSLPALKMVSCPWITSTRTLASACACSSTSAMPAYMAVVKEFFLATRWMVRVVTPPTVSIKRSVMRIPGKVSLVHVKN